MTARFRVGDRVRVVDDVAHSPLGPLIPKTGIVIRTEVLADEPPARASPLQASTHDPGALIYVVRSRFARVIPIDSKWEEHEIEAVGDEPGD